MENGSFGIYMLIQYPIASALLGAFLFWLKPWRMRTEAAAILNILALMVYAISFFTFGLALGGYVQGNPNEYLVMGIIFFAFVLPIAVYYLAAKTDKRTSPSHPLLEKSLYAGGVSIVFGVLLYAALGRFLGVYLKTGLASTVFGKIAFVAASIVLFMELVRRFYPAIIPIPITEKQHSILRWISATVLVLCLIVTILKI
ncbi:MAG: hypothetical protein WC641_01430 [Patescibacteria group bacterium]